MQPPFTHLSYFRPTSRWQADIGLGRKCEIYLSTKRVRTSKFSLSKELTKICTGRCPVLQGSDTERKGIQCAPKIL